MWDKERTEKFREKLKVQLIEYSLFIANDDCEDPNVKYSLKKITQLDDCMHTEDTLALPSKVASVVCNVIQTEIDDLCIMLAIIDAGEGAPITDVIDILGKEYCQLNFSCSDYLECAEAARQNTYYSSISCNACGSNGSCTSCANSDKCDYIFNYDLNRYVKKAAYKSAEDICKNHYRGDRYSNCQECPHYKVCNFYKYAGEYIYKDVYIMDRYKEKWKDLITVVTTACESGEDTLNKMLNF